MAAAFQCQPFAFNWDKSIPGGKCFDVTSFALSSSVPNIVSDVAILVLPAKTILEVKVSVGRRVGLGLIFLVGSVYVYLLFLLLLPCNCSSSDDSLCCRLLQCLVGLTLL